MERNNIKKKIECWIASGITIVLLVSLLFPWLTLDAKAEDGTIHIQSQNDLLKLAENCRWMHGLMIRL